MYSPVTHIFSQHDHDAVRFHIEDTAALTVSPFWTPGWPDELEIALLDAVFTARAPYGGPGNGVRRVLSRWRAYRSLELHRREHLDDIGALANFQTCPEDLAEILGNRQRVSGNSTTKADAAARAAATLIALGVRTAADLDDHGDRRRAVTAITGVGSKTWECALFLVGRRTPDAIRYLVAFISDAVGREVDLSEASGLLGVAAETLGSETVVLEHAAWRYRRRFPLPPLPVPLSEVG
ncbi:MAG: hypothetical protein WBG14_16040 [Rhodococcus sp. (in: high G+C Gram-positive bacteria)]